MSRHRPWTTWLKRQLPFDRQTHLNDLSEVPPALRRPRSSVIQFYSSYRNIGNFTPVLGIQGMLDEATDVWNMHRTPVDWDHVHRHHRVAIIGGAGLLHADFEAFWDDFDRHCRLPFVIWGIGVCLPHNESAQGVSRELARRVFAKAMLANVRDRLTFEHYRLADSTDISVCPTVPYLHDWVRTHAHAHATQDIDVLHSIHTTLASGDESARITRAIEAAGRSVRCVENLQRRRFGIDDALLLYCRARLVVSTRLHGAIIAFGLDRPYLALSLDSKVQAFVEGYGGGRLLPAIDELAPCLREAPAATGSAAAAAAARAFGQRARALLLR